MFVPVEGANNIISVKEQATDTNVGNDFILLVIHLTSYQSCKMVLYVRLCFFLFTEF